MSLQYRQQQTATQDLVTQLGLAVCALVLMLLLSPVLPAASIGSVHANTTEMLVAGSHQDHPAPRRWRTPLDLNAYQRRTPPGQSATPAASLLAPLDATSTWSPVASHAIAAPGLQCGQNQLAPGRRLYLAQAPPNA